MTKYRQESLEVLVQRQDIDDRKAIQLSGLLKRRLLVVDEDLDDLLYYSAVLQHHGYEVRSIPSYSDGATCLEREDFDLIIVSQGGPNFEGRRVLARAIEKDRRTPVLVFTPPQQYLWVDSGSGSRPNVW